MESKRIFIWLIILVAIVVILGFFINKPPENVVRIGVQSAWILEGPYYIAEEKGFFEEEGIKVDFVELRDFNEFVPALITKEILVVMNTADTLVVQSVREKNIRQILKKVELFGVDGILSSTDINSIEDIRGEKVAVETVSPSHFLLLSKLKDAGMGSEDIEVLPTSAGNAGATFVRGSVDVAVTWEPWLSRGSEREDGHILFSTREDPSLIYDIIMTRGDLSDKEEEQVKAILKAWFKAIEFIENNPEESKRIFSERLGLPEEEVEFFFTKFRFLDYEENLEFFGEGKDFSPAEEYANNAAQIWYDEEIITEKPDPSVIIDSSYLNELYN